jgi:hypothetical protein
MRQRRERANAQRPGQFIQRVRQLQRGVAHGPGAAALQAAQGAAQRTIRVAQQILAQADAVARQPRGQLVAAAQQLLPRTVVRMLGQPLPPCIAEHVGEEHVVVVRTGFEQQHVGILVFVFVLGDAHLQSGVDDGAEGLRQHHRQTAIDELAFVMVAEFGRPRRVVRHQRVDADHQLRPLLERHRGVQRLGQRPVHVPAPVDRHRRVQPRQRRTGLHRGGNGHLVVARRAKGHRSARVQVGGDQVEAVAQRSEVVAAPGRVEKATHHLVEAAVVEQPRRQHPGHPLEGGEEALAQRDRPRSRATTPTPAAAPGPAAGRTPAGPA